MLDWIACSLVKTISAILCRMSPDFAVWCGKLIGELAYYFQPKRRRIGILNLRAAFDGKLAPAKANQIVKGCYRQLGAGFSELLRLNVIDKAYIDRYIKIEGQAHIDWAIASGKPIVLI